MCYIVEMKAGFFFSLQGLEHRSSCMLGKDFIIDISTPKCRGVFIFHFKTYFLCVWVVLHTYISVRSYRSEEGIRMPVVSHHVGAGVKPSSL